MESTFAVVNAGSVTEDLDLSIVLSLVCQDPVLYFFAVSSQSELICLFILILVDSLNHQHDSLKRKQLRNNL